MTGLPLLIVLEVSLPLFHAPLGFWRIQLCRPGIRIHIVHLMMRILS